ncbi:MAG: tetratricopeptide repeat protein [Desulfobulbaceae bacterium]|uniref:Tetratricopeptide repeat protein n=1 Tax=Candidatus Desulfatifera sulfidica TaxID=2841691 RepID=A0A8J6N7X3_9BACT|nr:tetratricopeptide repeat protein [Candidatus Desulfatifera sulfidica]
MSNSVIQPIGNIAPVEKKEKKRSSDPAQAEYEDGQEFLSNKELGQAALAFHNALLAFEEKSNESGVANASNQLALLCLGRGDYAKALDHLRRAFEICERQDDPMSMNMLSKQLIRAHRGLGQTKEAIKLALELVHGYNLDNNPHETVLTLEQLAEIYIEANEAAKAADTYRTIASIHSRFKHKKMAAEFVRKAEALEAPAQ